MSPGETLHVERRYGDAGVMMSGGVCPFIPQPAVPPRQGAANLPVLSAALMVSGELSGFALFGGGFSLGLAAPDTGYV